jgi:hypothetical protein
VIQPPIGLAAPQPVKMLTIKDLAAELVKLCGLHEGLYDLAIEFNLGIGTFGPTPERAFPGALLGVSKIGLQKSPQVGPHTVDAAVINPPKKKRGVKAT